ncbi:cathepsin O isoform X3 [Phascolarctos cinereus]|uniref:Cathepsin O isoform X4 n=1 Tax=Phascolarctos cinereus TaxID=38626 RepID=A0A6P5KYR8_PHACI|nr:cathepsin O isoform X4 [Phascolarctos cinereus]
MKTPGLQWLWLFWGCSCSLGSAHSGLPRGAFPGAAAAANSNRSRHVSPERHEKGSAAFREDSDLPQFSCSTWEIKATSSRSEESLRRHIYLNSIPSSDNTSAIYGINQFSHLFPEEFKAIYLRSKSSELPLYNKEVKMPTTHVPLPVRFDWRDKHVVTKVRNQQMTQVRLVKDSEYSFKAQTGLCHYFSGSHAGVSIKGYSSYDFSDKEDEMAKVLLAYGPLAVIVDAVSWQDYLGGIIQHHCSSGEANHAVLITGFDKTGSTPYWIVRNSWGTSWGVDGYAFVKMGANICGIADSVSAVFV